MWGSSASVNGEQELSDVMGQREEENAEYVWGALLARDFDKKLKFRAHVSYWIDVMSICITFCSIGLVITF